MTTTLGDLKTQARQRADMETSTFVGDTELRDYINSSIAELHDILVQSYGSEYFNITYLFTTTEGQDSYPLPADFYKVNGVDVKLNGQDFISVKRFNFNERNRYNDITIWNLSGIPSIRYRVIGANLVFSPKPDGLTDVKMWYTPVAAKLSADSDTLNDFNQYSEYIITDVAIKMMQKEESDVQVLMAQKQALLQRITYASQNRDAGDPESVSDIYSENDEYYFRS